MNFINPWLIFWKEWQQYWLQLFWPHGHQDSAANEETAE